jgi:hypothetical protein
MVPLYVRWRVPHRFPCLRVVFSLPGPFYDSRSRTRDVASKTDQRCRIRRVGHGSRRGMTSLYYVGTVEPANSMPDPHGQRYLNFLSAQAVLQASTGADGTQRAVTRGCEAAAGRIRPAR